MTLFLLFHFLPFNRLGSDIFSSLSSRAENFDPVTRSVIREGVKKTQDSINRANRAAEGLLRDLAPLQNKLGDIREVSQEGFPSQKTFANLFAAGPGRKTFAKKPSFTTKGRNSSPPPPPPLSLLFPGHLLQNSLKALSAFLLPPKISGPCSYLRLVW